MKQPLSLLAWLIVIHFVVPFQYYNNNNNNPLYSFPGAIQAFSLQSNRIPIRRHFRRRQPPPPPHWTTAAWAADETEYDLGGGGNDHDDDDERMNGSSFTTKRSRGRQRPLDNRVGNQKMEQSITLSPYQILCYPSIRNDLAQAKEEFATSSFLKRPVSLDKGLQRMREAIQQLMQDAEAASTPSQQQQQQQQPPLLPSPPFFLRLEQVVHSDTTDPLAWLDAQVANDAALATSIIPFFRQLPLTAQAPLFYFGNQEGTTEVAVLGSVMMANETSQVWQHMPNLPVQSQWYGGEPFDKDTPRRGPWKAWTKRAWWILPALEVRRHGQETILAMHVNQASLTYVQSLLEAVTARQSAPTAPTTLPPILSRDGKLPDALHPHPEGNLQDGQDLYEQAVHAALPRFSEDLEKVVLARPQQLHFGVPLSGGQLLRRWKYGGHEGGHLFWMRPGIESTTRGDSMGGALQASPEFVGCTPERLFRVQDQKVWTEALAGTRPRGSTAAADAQLCRDLFDSPKDRAENRLTGEFIVNNLRQMEAKGWVTLPAVDHASVFVRRLRHLQHICHSYTANITDPAMVFNVTKQLLKHMHPTPAVCGVPATTARLFIREHESIGFDRGYYAGPIGYLGREQSDLVVAIRSGIIQRNRADGSSRVKSTLTLYAGAGIVPGSTVKGEWAETNYKLAVVSSLFPQSPFSLQGALTPNVAWAAAFVEELIRNGIIQFYICPGSRSTPLVVAISKALRSHLGIVHADSVHDERAAAFRALGYARGAGRPAAVITSSGTAVANLYPAIVEASMDGVPMLILTADRPYESRSTGANQAIDQVGIFSSSYIRWSRDIPPPSDEIPISLVLSDVDHAVDVSKRSRGPVHLNIQFRENLAPDAGRIRNDERLDAVTKFNADHFTSSPKFQRWSATGAEFTRLLSPSLASAQGLLSTQEIVRIIESSKRGIIVVGNVRPSTSEEDSSSLLSVMDAISEFAQYVGFPILSGVQSAALRFRSTAVVPFAEHLLRSPLVKDNLKPDLIIQIGAPLVSTEIPQAIKRAISLDDSAHHILVHPHTPQERFDPDFAITHRVDADVRPWLKEIQKEVLHPPTSELVSLIPLGRRLQSEMKDIIKESVAIASAGNSVQLSEPELLLSLAEKIELSDQYALFLSNSMPIRDAEAFLYPLSEVDPSKKRVNLSVVGTNRGASGIDGIIATAKGFAESLKCATTLLIGDVSALHDISSLHALANDSQNQNRNPGKSIYPLTTIVVNNNGGGIFSFLPIAAHGNDVNFDEFFGTPTSSYDFEKGSEAFGITCKVAEDVEGFRESCDSALRTMRHNLIEARVSDRSVNVHIHREISSRTNKVLENILKISIPKTDKLFLRDRHTKLAHEESINSSVNGTLLLLHGWMGDVVEWEESIKHLSQKLVGWRVLALDLPGHGKSSLEVSSELQMIRSSLGLVQETSQHQFSIEGMAHSILSYLDLKGGVGSIDAIAGYSLGGRIAHAMMDLSAASGFSGLLRNNTKLILLSAAPRTIKDNFEASSEEIYRVAKDDHLSSLMKSTSRFALLSGAASSESSLLWSKFVENWYSTPLWGSLKQQEKFAILTKRRCESLYRRGLDLALVLSACSPPRDRPSTPLYSEGTVLYVSGSRDLKYSSMGERWCSERGVIVQHIPDAGHAVLVESPELVAHLLFEFLTKNVIEEPKSEDSSVYALLDSDAETTAEADKSEGGLGATSRFFDFVSFQADLVDPSVPSRIRSGIGWGEKAKTNNALSSRSGILLEVKFCKATGTALGEASPLEGVHPESYETTVEIMESMKRTLSMEELVRPDFEHRKMLQLDGYFYQYSSYLESFAGKREKARSIYSALEMLLLNFASQNARLPILQAIAETRNLAGDQLRTTIALNGLMLRNGVREPAGLRYAQEARAFRSLKVKVGHQDRGKDIRAVSDAFERTDIQLARGGAFVRLDANRAWNESEAIAFVSSLEGIDPRSFDRIEFIEEPLNANEEGSFSVQVENLERLFRHAGLEYALDESLADLAVVCDYDYARMRDVLLKEFMITSRGCAAFVLKPTLLGLELSLQLATLARAELGISAIFTSCFESGVGLAYIAFLAAISDSIESRAKIYAHGLGTFEMLHRDTLIPSFGSHVDEYGQLNVASLSRSLFGLSLSELKRPDPLPEPAVDVGETSNRLTSATSASLEVQSSVQNETEVSFAVSLDLPFPCEIAHARFTDLPQQPRWSPWLTSVAYQGTKETEWKLNIRGIPLQWRATSTVLYDPWPSIAWESVSGLSNHGIVEFIPTGPHACEMRVRLATRPPRVLRPLFRGASIFLEDFIRDKLLKWSLEMFRDVVKADLALERGDVELGDALFGSVAGKAVAIEAALNSKPSSGITKRRKMEDKSIDD